MQYFSVIQKVFAVFLFLIQSIAIAGPVPFWPVLSENSTQEIQMRLADMTHADWQNEARSSGKTERFKLVKQNSQPVLANDQAALNQYLDSRGITQAQRVFFRINDGKVEEDILNLPNRLLADNNRQENEASAQIATDLIQQRLLVPLPLDAAFIEQSAATIHDAWVIRNRSWAPAHQLVPFSELTAEEQEKDRVIVKRAITLAQELFDDNLTSYDGLLSRANQYRAAIGESLINDRSGHYSENHNSKIATSSWEFIGKMANWAGSAPVVISEFVGFSGAGYDDASHFELAFRNRILDIVADTKKKFGPAAKNIFLLGGTVVGIGKGHDILHAMKADGSLVPENTFVADMVSNQAVPYHLEGIAKNWGDEISPHTDALFLVNSYRNADGTQSWETKETANNLSHTATILTGHQIKRIQNLKHVGLEVFEGGAIATKEVLEYQTLVSIQYQSAVTSSLTLHLGFEAGKPKKDTGHRAARDVRNLLDQIKGYAPFETIEHRGVPVSPVKAETLDIAIAVAENIAAISKQNLLRLGQDISFDRIPDSIADEARGNYIYSDNRVQTILAVLSFLKEVNCRDLLTEEKLK